MPKKVCILASVFWPIYPGYGGRHAYVMAENLAAAGYEVDVVAAFPIDLRRKGNFFRQKPIAREKLNGIRVFRVFSLLPIRLGLFSKLLFYISFMFTSLMAIPLIRKADYVLGLHPPPAWLLIPGFVFSRLLRAKYIIRVTDLWPDVVFEFKVANRTPLRQIVNLMARLTYGSATHIMAFTPQIMEQMLKRGIPERNVSVVEMAIDTDLFRPMATGSEERLSLGLAKANGKFVVLYAGAFALTYDFDLFLRAARLLERENITFVLLGDGDAKKQIVGTIHDLGLDNVLMPSPVSRPEMVARYINCSDVCVMPLKPEMLTSTLTRPSKVFEFWACGKPVISCTKGEMELLTRESGAGTVVSPGDVEGFARAIRHLYENPDVTKQMGANARQYVTGRFSLESLKSSLIATLEHVN